MLYEGLRQSKGENDEEKEGEGATKKVEGDGEEGSIPMKEGEVAEEDEEEEEEEEGAETKEEAAEAEEEEEEEEQLTLLSMEDPKDQTDDGNRDEEELKVSDNNVNIDNNLDTEEPSDDGIVAAIQGDSSHHSRADEKAPSLSSRGSQSQIAKQRREGSLEQTATEYENEILAYSSQPEADKETIEV